MQRFYRSHIDPRGRFAFNVIIEESDLFIISDKNLEKKAYEILKKIRKDLEDYIKLNPNFKDSLLPININSSKTVAHAFRPAVFVPNIPPIIKSMITASKQYNVGPMASVAGAVSEFLGKELLHECNYIMIENGGDIFVKSDEPFILSIWAGENSPFNGKLKIKLNTGGNSLGICASSGMFGHSLSFGKADAVVTISTNTLLADAAATAIANKVQTKEDIQSLADEEQEKEILDGLIIIKDDRAAMWGDFELV